MRPGSAKPGDTVIINGGTTTFLMAEYLPPRGLRVLTNSFLLAERLLSGSEHEVILPGGSVYREQNVIVSPFENDVAQHHYASTMFMSAHGLSALGLMESDPLAGAGRTALDPAGREAGRARRSHEVRAPDPGWCFAAWTASSCLITDSGAPDAVVQWLEQQGLQVVVVQPDSD